MAVGSKYKVKTPGEFEKVGSIIDAVKQHKNFKQMAQYNISCLLLHIAPPTVGWKENVMYAIESGGIESIIAVLKKHPAALAVVKTSIEALRLLSINGESASRMAKAGGVQTALDAMLKSTDPEVAEQGAGLLTQIAQHAPNAILESDGALEGRLVWIELFVVWLVDPFCMIV